ncbi:tetratricopeptide repeat protein [Gemmatimonadota bacterium]
MRKERYSAGHFTGLLRICQASLRLLVVLSVFLPETASAQQRTGQAMALSDSGFVLLEQEDYQNAREVFDQALRLDRNLPSALLGIGKAWLELPQGGSRALGYLTRATVISPESMEAHYYRALAHVRLSETDFLGRSNSRQAIKSLEKVIAINPSHPDAYFLIGCIERDSFEDYGSAIEAFTKQVATRSDHVEAWQALLMAEIDIGNWDTAVSLAESTLTRNPGIVMAYPLLAAAHYKADRLEESMAVFERFFARLSEKERGVYFDLQCILTPAEQRDYAGLTDAGRSGYWTHYWRTKDPEPKTPVNERLLEHFIRVAYARIEFSDADWPWDGRGECMIRYGEAPVRLGPGHPLPTEPIDEWEFYLKQCELADRMGWQRPVFNLDAYNFTLITEGFDPWVDGSGTPERWIYTNRGLDVKFQNPVMSGNYLSSPQVESMIHLLPVMSEETEKIQTFDPQESAVTFKGPDGQTTLNYAIGIIPDDLGGFRSLTGEYAYIDAQMELYTEEWQAVAGTRDSVGHIALRPQIEVRGYPMFVHQTSLSVEPGEYLFSTYIVDRETGIRSTGDEQVSLPDYSGSDLMVSDILPAARITEVGPGRSGRFILGDLEVYPLPGRFLGQDQPLFIYFEIYNLDRDTFGGTRYSIEYVVVESTSDDGSLKRLYQGLTRLAGISRRRSVLSSEFVRSGIENDVSVHLEIDMSAPEHGVYDLIVNISDQVSGQSGSSMMTFRTLPPVPPSDR